MLCGVTAGAWEWTGIKSRILRRAEVWLGPERLEFGRVPVGSREQRVLVATNFGEEDVVLSRITADSAFLVAPSSLSLAAGESREIVVTFVPEVAGPVASKLVVESEPRGRYSVPLAATAYRPAEVQVTPLGVSFGAVGLGRTSSGTISIYNAGDEDLVLEGLGVRKPFGIGTVPRVVPPAERVDVTLTFSPEESGSYEATLIIRSSDALHKRVAVNVSGSGSEDPPEAEIELAWAVLDFGAVPVCVSKQQSLAIRNHGEDVLTVSTVTSRDPFDAPNRSRRIAPGRTLELPITFAPRSAGRVQAPLVIESNDPTWGTLIIDLVGEGHGDAPCEAIVVSEVLSDEPLRRTFALGDSGGSAPTRRESEPGVEADTKELFAGAESTEAGLADADPGETGPPPTVLDGSRVHFGTYGTELSSLHIDAVRLSPGSQTLALEGVTLPTVELPFDEFFEFVPTSATGAVNDLGDVEMTLPLKVLDQSGNEMSLDVLLTTGTTTTLTADGTQIALTGEPLQPDGYATLVGALTFREGGLEGQPMEIVLHVRAQE